jgi:hypothetical protein
MRFFDSKEEVLDIQLTQYGKQLLSQGDFAPVYYSFHDDDILYDTGYIGYTEIQNESEGRIQEGTPRLKTQYVFEGLETNIQKLNTPDVLEDKKHFALPYSLGTSSPRSEYLPSWTILFLEGELYNSQTFITGSKYTVNIPQLKTRIDPTIRIKTQEDVDIPPEEFNESSGFFELPTKIYNDGTYVDIENKFLLLEVEENNSIYEKENFDIEVYEVKNKGMVNSAGKSVEELIRLDFMLPNADNTQNYTNTGKNFVEYYLDIQVDSEIDPDVIAKRKTENIKNIFVDGDIFRESRNILRSEEAGAREDIYEVELDPDDYEEPCD